MNGTARSSTTSASAVMPKASAVAIDMAISPIHGIGRYENNWSSGLTGSTSAKVTAMLIRFRWVSIAPLGDPVVPEV